MPDSAAIPPWFSSMPEASQKAYLKEHPDSNITHSVRNESQNQNKEGPVGPSSKTSNNQNVSKVQVEKLTKELQRYKAPVLKVYKSLPTLEKAAVKTVADKLKNNEKLNRKDAEAIEKFGLYFQEKRRFGVGTFLGNYVKSVIGGGASLVGQGVAIQGSLVGHTALEFGLGAIIAVAGFGYSISKDIANWRGIYRSLHNTKEITPDKTKEVLKHSNLSSIRTYYQQASLAVA